MLFLRINILFFIPLTFWIITFSKNTFAQSDVNYSKYWYYRYKLQTKYVKRGYAPDLCGKFNDENDGLSVPVTEINNGSQSIHWGDSPERLGLYIGVLATEYALLNSSGYSTDSVKQELFYAMKAFERMDYRAERFYYPSTTQGDTSSLRYACERNGFFTRSAASPRFFAKYRKGGTNPFFKYNGFGSDANNHQRSVLGLDGTETRGSNQMSIDHATFILIGMALVKKLVGGVYYTYPPTGEFYDFENMAEAYAHSIVNYLKQNDWVLYVPHSGQNTLVSNVSTGVECQATSWLMAKAGEWITGKSSGTFTTEVPYWAYLAGTNLQYPGPAALCGC